MRPLISKLLFSISLISFMSISPLAVASTNTTKIPNASEKLPQTKPDFSKLHSPERQKQFIDYMLPFVQAAQADILKKRQTLLTIQSTLVSNNALSKSQKEQLEKLSHLYKVTYNPHDPEASVQKLLSRINILPISMILAQAALESGWGTSRFAQKGNNYFGQHCYTRDCGIVPAQRAPGSSMEVAKFASTLDGVKSYLHMLNTGNAYRQLRQARSAMLHDGKSFDGLEMIQYLDRYSALPSGEYEKRLAATIKSNNLTQYDQVQPKTEKDS